MSQSSEAAENNDTDASPADCDPSQLKQWIEAALLAAGQPLTLNQLNALFPESEQPGHGPIREALALLDAELGDRAVELIEVAGGYRLQIRSTLMPVVSNLWAEKPPKYSRALLETLAIIAYRQPITRGEIEQIRGVSLSANILKTLQEREWIKVVGHRDIPGKPELLGTTKSFLDYFGLKGLDDLPTLAEIRDIDNIEPELEFNDPEPKQAANDDELAQDPIEPKGDEQVEHPTETGREAGLEGTEGDPRPPEERAREPESPAGSDVGAQSEKDPAQAGEATDAREEGVDEPKSD